ncbi:MAG TPA: hypothetical protein VIC08_07120 [Cellvibrionaceae bacterium]
MSRIIISVIVGLLPAAAFASGNYHYSCKLQDEVRLIEVVYLLPEQTVPCEVRYQKNQEEPEVLWRANNQEGFCEIEAQKLKRNQESWGFTCEDHNVPARAINSGLY